MAQRQEQRRAWHERQKGRVLFCDGAGAMRDGDRVTVEVGTMLRHVSVAVTGERCWPIEELQAKYHVLKDQCQHTECGTELTDLGKQVFVWYGHGLAPAHRE